MHKLWTIGGVVEFQEPIEGIKHWKFDGLNRTVRECY